MTNYDFRSLNDKEFEALCVDLIGTSESKRLERFKPGRDLGVDGRFFTSDGQETILQCKHWSNTPVKDLVANLRKTELPKIQRLRPKRYLVAVSNNLSRLDKKAIKTALEPYIIIESDIFGNEDLNDLLRSNQSIERSHYKLWLHSAAVLSNIVNSAVIGRSNFAAAEMHQRSRKYVMTDNHKKSLEQLERIGVVVITGEPGVGKTTLAEQLCVQHIADGYQLVHILDKVTEAEAVFDHQERQIFYFDDFLGRNYLEAISGRDGSHVAQFMRRIASDKNKRFILTSRSNILNQGKILIDALENHNIKRNEYELRIDSLSGMDKAKILYNHIWFSGLMVSHIDALYEDKRYRAIINHRNFNPRLISFITDSSRIEGVPHLEYWQFVQNSLADPKQIWEHAFISQQDDFCRILVILAVINRQPISEDKLLAAYNRSLAMPSNLAINGRRDFYANTRILTGTFLSRSIDKNGKAIYSIFNPSVADYIISRHGSDEDLIKSHVLALRSVPSISTLLGLEQSKKLSKESVAGICMESVRVLYADGITSENVNFLAWAARVHIDRVTNISMANTEALLEVFFFVVQDKFIPPTDDFFYLAKYGFENNRISLDEVLNFLERSIPLISSDDEISATTSLLKILPDQAGVLRAWEKLEEHVSTVATEEIQEFADLDEAFRKTSDPEDFQNVHDLVCDIVEDRLIDLGFPETSTLAKDIVYNSSIEQKFDRYWESRREGYGGYRPSGQGYSSGHTSYDAIDDLFERT